MWRNRRLAAAAVLAAGATLIAGTWTAGAQVLGSSQGDPPPVTLFPPPPGSTPTTTAVPTAPPPSTDTTAPGDGSTAPPGDGGAGPTGPMAPVGVLEPPPPADGDGAVPPAGEFVPPNAQQAINSIARTAPNDNSALVAGAAALQAAGIVHDDAVGAVYGRFPVLGPTRWVDDWYFPRWTGATFRHHLGLDMMAPYGTPLAAPVDGIARISTNALGGLTIRVVEPDGTFWYLAHLSGIADGVVDGSAVTVGQVVGFVGDSGNARGGAPHLHFAVHPQGGPPIPPKPIVDQWVADGAARVPELLAGINVAPLSAAAVATALTRGLATGLNPAGASAPVGPARSELLWASAANPAGGGVRLAEAAAAAVNSTVDWEQRAALQRALDEAWSRATGVATSTLGPLTSPALRQAVEARRAGAASVSP